MGAGASCESVPPPQLDGDGRKLSAKEVAKVRNLALLRRVLYVKAFNAKGPDATIEDLFSTYKRTNSDGATVLRRDDIMRAIDHTGPWFDDLLRAYAPPQPPGAAHDAPEEVCLDCLVNFVLTGSVLPASRCTDSTRTSTRRPTACFGAFERRLDELGGDISLGEADAALRAAEHSLRVDDVELGPREALRAPDHSALHGEKRVQHLIGTRQWVFDEFDAWLASLTADKLFWLMGSGGTGKSVIFAVLLDRLHARGLAIAWHYLRHDDAASSKTVTIIRSFAAMCCKTVPGFEELLRADLRTFFEKGGDLDAMLPANMFALLVGEPLSKVPAPEHKCVICIDALDELPRDDVGAVLKLFTDSFSKLPRWVGILVTSRGEAHIKAALSKKFTPMELKVDETRNQGDMRVFLRHIARGKFNDTSLSLADVELAIQKEFSGIVMVGKLAPLEPLLLASKGVYNGVMPEIVRQPKYDVLVKIPDLRPVPPLLQSSTSFDALFIEAAVAQEAVKATIAVLWEAAAGSKVRHPTSGKLDWVESADDPGIKGLERSLEKMKKDYDGKFQRLTDIARLTMRFTSPARLVQAFMEMQKLPELKLVQVKNRFGSRTPLGYADLNVLYKVLIREGVSHYVEAKDTAHKYYEKVRSEIPKICAGTAHEAGALEASIMKRLDNSALDAVVDLLALKAGGLFIYARLLDDHLAQAGASQSFAALAGLPAGLDEMYEAEFLRCFGDDKSKWQRCAGLVSMIVAAREPLPVGIARSIMGTAACDEAAAEFSILFPSADGKFRVLHKSVTDWLLKPERAGQRFYLGPDQVADAHFELARALEGALSLDSAPELTAYAVVHVVYHQVRAASKDADDAAKMESFASLRLTLRDAGFCARRVTLGQRSGLAKDYADAIARAPAAAARALKEWSKYARLYAPFIAERPLARTGSSSTRRRPPTRS
ncbi:hypothetical protein M885DRAFT_184687 [Pelagophyceae sp. CCMP2097]|nr:hypothetical protein M885DRAFT_184687 [Pelagophyceae sp. CCMP2097]